jgi:hypothetical protein
MPPFKNVAFVGGIVATMGTGVYFAIIEPMQNKQKYRDMQAEVDVARNIRESKGRDPKALPKWQDPFAK